MIQLPPLPEPTDLLQVMWRGDREFARPVGEYFTADQLRADRLAIIEACARVCGKLMADYVSHTNISRYPPEADDCAAALRALKEQVK